MLDISLLRLKKEFQDVGIPEFCRLKFNSESLIENINIETLESADSLNLCEITNNFIVILKPDEGVWYNKIIQFLIKVPKEYPFKPPKIKCLNKILHPNIDKFGNVCINIIREDWKPTFTISIVVCGLLNLLIEPNNTDPFNQFASFLFDQNYNLFVSINRLLLN